MPALRMSSKPGKTQSKLVYDIRAVSPINTVTGNHLQPLSCLPMKTTTSLVSRKYEILGKSCAIVPTTTSEQIFSNTAAKKASKKFLSDFPAIPKNLDWRDEKDWKKVM